MADDKNLWNEGRLPTGPNVNPNEPRLGPGPRVDPETRYGPQRRTVLPSTGQGRADYIKGLPDPSQPSNFPGRTLIHEVGPGAVEKYLRDILYNARILSSFNTLGNAITARVVTVTTSPTLIIPANKIAQSYRLLNQGIVAASPLPFLTIFPSAARAAGTFTSATFNVAGAGDLRAFLSVTVAGGTVRVDVQTQDPLSLGFATAQSDIFGTGTVAPAINTFYARVGDIGVDSVLQLIAVVTGAAVTFSVSGFTKQGSVIDLGRTVFIGDANVNTTNGYPIPPTQERIFFLKENTALYGLIPVNPGGSVPLKVFELR